MPSSPIHDHIAFFFTLRSFRLCSGSGFMKMMMMFGAIIFDTMSFGDEDLPARKERRTLFKLIQQQEMREEGNGAAVLCVLCEICCVCDPGKGSLPFSVQRINSQFRLRMLMAFRHFTIYLLPVCALYVSEFPSIQTDQKIDRAKKRCSIKIQSRESSEQTLFASWDSGNEIGNYPILFDKIYSIRIHWLDKILASHLSRSVSCSSSFDGRHFFSHNKFGGYFVLMAITWILFRKAWETFLLAINMSCSGNNLQYFKCQKERTVHVAQHNQCNHRSFHSR